MFNVGSEDKEKLRENMEEIKNLIQGKKDQEQDSVPSPSKPNNDSGESSLETGIEDSEFDNSQPLGSDNGSTNEQLDPSGSETPTLGEQNTTNNTSSSEQVSEGGFGSDLDNQDNTVSSQKDLNTPQQGNNLQENTQNEPQFGSQNTSPTDNNQGQVVNSTPPQNSQQPQQKSRAEDTSQKLFLEVERFEKVKDMIDEMKQLTEDIETTSNDLEDQIGEERESENVAQQLLNNFDDRKREVEDVILDSEEN